MRFSPSTLVCPNCHKPLWANALRRTDLFCKAGCHTTVTVLDDGHVQFTAPGTSLGVFRTTLADIRSASPTA